MKAKWEYFWGLFFISVGIYWLIPDDIIPNGVGHLIIAAFTLGYSFMSYSKGIKHYLLMALGVCFGLYGFNEVFDLDFGIVPIGLIGIGVYLLISNEKKEVIVKLESKPIIEDIEEEQKEVEVEKSADSESETNELGENPGEQEEKSNKN